MTDLHSIPKHATLLLNPLPKVQTKDEVHAAVDEVLKRSGCSHCGFIAFLNIGFNSNPDPSLNQNVVTSAHFSGF